MDEHTAETFDQKYEREAAEADAFLARCAERRLERERSQALPTIEKPKPKAKQQMDREWNEWFAAGFRNFAALERKWVSQQLELVVKIVAEETQRKENELRLEIIARRDALYAEIRALKEQVAALKCDIEVLTKRKAAKSDVVPLMRARDVA